MSWLPITDLFSFARTMFSFTSCVDWCFFSRNEDKGNALRCRPSSDRYRAVCCKVSLSSLSKFDTWRGFFATRSFLQMVSAFFSTRLHPFPPNSRGCALTSHPLYALPFSLLGSVFGAGGPLFYSPILFGHLQH